MRKKRMLSGILATVMIITMLPATALPIYADSDELANGASDKTGYYHYEGVDAIQIIGWEWMKNKYGYKVSVWISEMIGRDADGNPIFDWSNTDTTEKIGKTIYWTQDSLTEGPATWYDANIFEQTTRRTDIT